MKRGLVLSGGAAWGLANIGVLEVLEREKCVFDCIAGSSMGAIVAGAYALGIPIKKLQELSAKISLIRIATIAKNPLQRGLHGGLLRQQLEKILQPIIGNSFISDTKIPFVCVAGKVSKPVQWHNIFFPGFSAHFQDCITPYVFPPETRMIDALLASSAIPVVFAPILIGSDEFVDLVHFGAIPARQLRTLYHPDIVIGTDTNPRYGFLQRLLPPPWREFLDHGHKERDADKMACDVMIEPKMSAPMFRFDRGADFIASGRSATEKSFLRSSKY